MKRERRHELHDNLLAHWLAEASEKVVPYARAAGLITVFAVLVIAAWYVFSNRSHAAREAAWGTLYQAMQKGTASDLEAVAEQYGGTEAALWAQVAAADIHLEIGCAQMFSNKADAVQELQKAIDGYVAVRDKVRRPELKERLLWGLARAYEALAGSRQGQGELDRAIQLYRELAESFPEGRFATLAQRRAAELSRQDVQGFYDFFASYEPSPTTSPGNFTPGELPFDPSALPAPPGTNTTAPGSGGAAAGEGEASPPGGPATPTPATPVSPKTPQAMQPPVEAGPGPVDASGEAGNGPGEKAATLPAEKGSNDTPQP